MPIRMDREKMNKILGLVGNIKSSSSDKQVLTMCSIVERCVDIVDDIQEDLEFLEEENERMKFELQDKRFEESRRGRRR